MVLPEGRLVLPFWGDQSPDPDRQVIMRSGALRVAISDDRGQTFRHIEVATVPPGESLGAGFPILTMDDAGALHLAHMDAEGHIQVRTSADQAETWSEPVRWSGERPSGFGVWAHAAGGVLSVMYPEAQTGDIVLMRGRVTDGAAGGPTQRAVVARGIGVSGDFPHFAGLADGRIVATWRDPGAIYVSIGPEPPAPA